MDDQFPEIRNYNHSLSKSVARAEAYRSSGGRVPFAMMSRIRRIVKLMAKGPKSTNTRTKRVAWTKEHVRDLKAHSKSKTPVAKI
jgi:hypothetical protein